MLAIPTVNAGIGDLLTTPPGHLYITCFSEQAFSFEWFQLARRSDSGHEPGPLKVVGEPIGAVLKIILCA